MIPALQISAFRRAPSRVTASMQARTDAGSDSSQASARELSPRPASPSRAFSAVRPVPTTRAPRSASTRTVSRPRPELHPVTSIVCPRRSIPFVTSSAVDP